MIAVEKLPKKKSIPLGNRGEVVLLDPSSATSFDPARNIVLINDRNQVVWQVEAAVSSHGAVGYSDVYVSENRELLAYGSNGIEYAIDQATGRIVSRDLIR